MHLITTLRSLLAAPRRGVSGALLIAVLIAGVVSMHSMSGSPSVHLPPAGVVTAHEVQHADHTTHDAHDMTTAMCLMVLVVLLTLAASPANVLHAVMRPLARLARAVAPSSRPAPAPSLHALGISRT
ncbi:hypothetical protein [Oerskovia flava]|uniref:hypothetical protein n=1 Tax=Oerskovia flava TaxID=2986422 RepID=UPI00223EC0B6|nr:hypothetical protein [Oerskovia sp. JB1-3-2]